MEKLYFTTSISTNLGLEGEAAVLSFCFFVFDRILPCVCVSANIYNKKFEGVNILLEM